MAIFVDDCFDAERGLHVPVEEVWCKGGELEGGAGARLAVYGVDCAGLAAGYGELAPVGSGAEAGDEAIIFVVDGETRAGAANHGVGFHASDCQRQGFWCYPGVTVAGPQV